MRIYSTEDIDLDNTDIDPEQWLAKVSCYCNVFKSIHLSTTVTLMMLLIFAKKTT